MKIIFQDPLRSWRAEGKFQLEGASKQINLPATLYWYGAGGLNHPVYMKLETMCYFVRNWTVQFVPQRGQSNSILFSGSPGFQDTRLLLPLLPLCSYQTFRALKHNKHDLSMPTNNINLRTVSFNPFNKFWQIGNTILKFNSFSDFLVYSA